MSQSDKAKEENTVAEESECENPKDTQAQTRLNLVEEDCGVSAENPDGFTQPAD